ncbi:MAG: phosphoglucosamine mutase [Candidatus Altiarchaeota archaeon]|nr:phosphoglucosamine mutase [Candidatus Altiarchaeota archaeon]
MTDRLFGTSGIRRKVKDINGEFVADLAMALGTCSRDKVIAVGMDCRESSPRIKEQFISALNISGKNAVDLGLVPTPTVAMASEEYGTSVVVTASHNPPEYNGFKFWGRGKAYSPDQERGLQRAFQSREFRQVKVSETKAELVDYLGKHMNRILKKVGRVSDEVRIMVDCANGAGSVITPSLLGEMGCQVEAINTETNGLFPHGLEPTEENLRETCSLVKGSGVDVAVAHDGDADRTAAIDSRGRLVDWDSFLSVLAYGKNKVVTTVDASMRVEEVCGEVIRTPVGDVSVANAVKRENADFGGEPSGSFIFPEVHLFPDGILTAAVTAKMVSENRFYEILDEVNEYPTLRVKIPCEENMKRKIMASVLKKAERLDYELNTIDGVRLSSQEGWFLIRPSGTESFIRITAEATTKKKLNQIVREGRNMLDIA